MLILLLTMRITLNNEFKVKCKEIQVLIRTGNIYKEKIVKKFYKEVGILFKLTRAVD